MSSHHGKELAVIREEVLPTLHTSASMYLVFQQYRSGKQKNNKSNHKQALNNTTQVSVELELESVQ